jgi:hypothetical protein
MNPSIDIRMHLFSKKRHAFPALLFDASVELMQVMARACGHDALSKFNNDDLATLHR